MKKMGVSVTIDGNDARVRGSKFSLLPIFLETSPYPGFPTDLQAPITAAMTQAIGESCIVETIYRNRFAHVNWLTRMGANVSVNENRVIIRGPTKLTAETVSASDLRCCASLYMAALAADGESTVENVQHVDRGYEHFDEKLRSLGAIVTRI
jgi:UDP-N-acetylglucosamine 1-carboxyvinyltransferase